MKKIYYVPVLAVLAGSMAMAFPASYHAATSSLREGKWVKMSIDSTGVYQIPYSRLKELGFDDPSKVAVCGRGMMPGPMQLADSLGNSLVDADVYTAPSMTRDSVLYFYGVGPRWVGFYEDAAASQPRFERRYKYTEGNRGYYLLTDAVQAIEMDTMAVTLPDDPDFAPVSLEKGYSYLFHDTNKRYGIKNSGTVFFSEIMEGWNLSQKWSLHPAGHSGGFTDGIFSCSVYADDNTPSAFMLLKFNSNELDRKAFPKEDVNILKIGRAHV